MEKRELSVPEFTAEDYINSSAPYEWLEQFKNDKFLLQQKMEQLKAAAGAVGVRSFVKLWNCYMEASQAKRGVKLDNATAFEGQPVELFSGQYICDDYGVRVLDRYGYEVPICVHPIMPTRRLINIDEGEERLELAYKKGRTWRTIIVEKSVIASSQQILQLAAYGVVVTSENAKLLSSYLLTMEQLNYENLQEQHSVGRLGWVLDHEFSPYVEDLTFDGEGNFRHMFNAVRTAGSREAWIEAMKKVRDEKSVARIFLAASFASALVEPCGILPFFVHAFGGQGTGKTVALMVAASVWACPKMGEYLISFNSTDVGQEMVAAFLNSMPICMDELQIQASSGVREFDKMVYKLTQGIGRVRGAKNGGIRRTVTWKNCILTTGEFPIINPNSMGGASVIMASGLDLPANARGVIADSAFFSPKDVIGTALVQSYKVPTFPMLPVMDLWARIIAGYSLTATTCQEALDKTSLPFLFIHGTADELVPYEMGLQNYTHCHTEKQMLTVEGAAHCCSYYVDPVRYISYLDGFLKRYGQTGLQ